MREARAAKQGFSCDRETREKKLIWMTAIISTPTILPEIRPSTQNTIAAADMAVETVDMMLAVLYVESS